MHILLLTVNILNAPRITRHPCKMTAPSHSAENVKLQDVTVTLDNN